MTVKVAGVQHHLEDALAFAKAVQGAERNGTFYGAELKPEPTNKFDHNAIAVYGVVGRQRWHIGYLDAFTAEEVTNDLVKNGLAIACQLYSIYVGENDYMDVTVIVLAPPGNGLKARLRKRRK